jgi:hypothetical protein
MINFTTVWNLQQKSGDDSKYRHIIRQRVGCQHPGEAGPTEWLKYKRRRATQSQ